MHRLIDWLQVQTDVVLQRCCCDWQTCVGAVLSGHHTILQSAISMAISTAPRALMHSRQPLDASRLLFLQRTDTGTAATGQR
jgi:hypothetical protein